MRNAGVGAVIFVPGPNFAYLTGVHLHLMERPTFFVLTAQAHAIAMIPGLEREKWGVAMKDAETWYWTDTDGPDTAFAAVAGRLADCAPLGFEGMRMRAAEFRAWATHVGTDVLTDVDHLCAELRLLKDSTEIADLRHAIKISEAALGETLDAGIGGQTGHQIEARLKAAMLSHGASGFAFDPIVLSGPEAANPHGDVSDRIVRPGDGLLIDFGASWGDMHADITRTVFCGHASTRNAEIYEAVLAANTAGRQSVRAGAEIGAVDAAATDLLNARGYRDFILHKTGHGLGRDVHEAPVVARSNPDVQRARMVFTVEPGLYEPGNVGVRIEDNVLVTAQGHDCLTSFPRELLTLD